MAFRILGRAVASSTSSNSAATAAGAAAALSLSGTAKCDSQPQGPSFVAISDSWENLLKIEDEAKLPPVAAPARAVERDQSVVADNCTQGAVLGSKPSSDVVTFSLAPPSQAETDKALFQVESLLKQEMSSSSFSSSDGDATESMAVSEQALIRASTLMADTGNMEAMSSANNLSQSAPPSAGVWHQARSVRTLGGGGQGDGVLSAGGSTMVLARGGRDGHAWDLSQQSNVRNEMMHVLDKHKDKVSSLLCKPALWDVLMNSEEFMDILNEEQGSVNAHPQESARIEEFNGEEAAVQQESGLWSFFVRIQERIEGMVSNFKGFLLPGIEKTAPQSKGNLTENAEGDDNAGPWGVLRGVLGVVAAVAVLLVLQRVKAK